jgi:hypothetical protein
MANRRTHRRAGRIAGGVYAAHRAKEQRLVHCVAETVGGALGGEFGAILADVVEPGISSWHRGPAHSCAAGMGILSLGDTLTRIEMFCRQQAEQTARKRATLQMIPDLTQPNLFVPAPNSALTQFFLAIAELFWRVSAGFANGIAAGYLSHLVLDAGTPRSIPLLTNGF